MFCPIIRAAKNSEVRTSALLCQKGAARRDSAISTTARHHGAPSDEDRDTTAVLSHQGSVRGAADILTEGQF